MQAIADAAESARDNDIKNVALNVDNLKSRRFRAFDPKRYPKPNVVIVHMGRNGLGATVKSYLVRRSVERVVVVTEDVMQLFQDLDLLCCHPDKSCYNLK